MKKIIQCFLLLAVFSTSFFTTLDARIDYEVEAQAQVLEQAATIEHRGVLKSKANGFVYLDVSNEFIASLLPLIEAPGRLDPPADYKSKKGIGAHISVIYEDERLKNDIWEMSELSQMQEFTFEVLELRTIKINSRGKVKKLWILAVQAPALEALRESYGLPPLLKGHDFHITLGNQLPSQVVPLPSIGEIEEEIEEQEAA